MQYRKLLYSNYHSTQSGRASGTTQKELFNREKWQFKNEGLPLLLPFSKDVRIFDMGCGSGSLLKILQETGYKNTSGMDISPEQVKIAEEMGVTGVVEGDALNFIAENSGVFDVVLGMDIIEHFTKDELTVLLQNIHKSLKPGGMAIFRTPNMDAFLSSVFAYGDFTHENYLNASSAEQVCMACGYSSVTVLPGLMRIKNPVKELCRKLVSIIIKLRFKLYLFATARSSKNVLWSPNMLIVATK